MDGIIKIQGRFESTEWIKFVSGKKQNMIETTNHKRVSYSIFSHINELELWSRVACDQRKSIQACSESSHDLPIQNVFCSHWCGNTNSDPHFLEYIIKLVPCHFWRKWRQFIGFAPIPGLLTAWFAPHFRPFYTTIEFHGPMAISDF